jgi:hypothetical protein
VLLVTRRRGFDAHLLPGKTHTERGFLELVAAQDVHGVSHQPWQMDYDLVWAVRRGHSGPGLTHQPALLDVLRCPACGVGTFDAHGASLECQGCCARFERGGGVVELRRKLGRPLRGPAGH